MLAIQLKKTREMVRLSSMDLEHLQKSSELLLPRLELSIEARKLDKKSLPRKLRSRPLKVQARKAIKRFLNPRLKKAKLYKRLPKKKRSKSESFVD